jgi:primosomal protein N' (replication factor Y) (superfamily II helicase)
MNRLRSIRSSALRYAQVAINRPLDHELSYTIPGPLSADVHLGSIVEVPLRGQKAPGVVTAILDTIDFKGKVKPIGRVLTPDYTLDDDLIELARWIAGYYWCSFGEALAAVSFIGLNDVHARTQVALALAAPDHWLAVSRTEGPDGAKVSEKQTRVINALLARGNDPLPPQRLGDEAGVSQSVLQTMVKRGWLDRGEEEVVREDDYFMYVQNPTPRPTLTSEQQPVLDAILKPVLAGEYQSFVLRGVTGSGKTEVFLRAIEEGLRLGRSAIVLVPEIALTPQTVQVFRERLRDLVGVYHSRMSLGQKYDLWRRIAGGEVRVLIGARSAIFAPMSNLGIIVVDEEHETSYKQADTPRYHARDVAVWRASRQKAVAILASATPSLESLHNTREGKYHLLEMRRRVGPHASPIMKIIDMRRHLVESDGEAALGPISPQLREAIALRLKTKEQVVLLLNRRGFANQVLCLACETVVQCPRCDVSLTYHKTQNKLVCHWCHHTQPPPEKCPKCGAAEIKALGLGTQKVEESLAEAFPNARTVRIDVDSMKGRRSFIEAWEKISKREIDIILGTQMVAKGFHLEHVTLVGVVSADFALFLPDFRSAERTFNLLTQVAGRAGRGDIAGEVIVQTYMPHHYAIDLAARLEADAFYERELHIRKMLRFPPMARLIGVLASGEDAQAVRDQISRLANMLKTLARRPSSAEVSVLGPAPHPSAASKTATAGASSSAAPRPAPCTRCCAKASPPSNPCTRKARCRSPSMSIRWICCSGYRPRCGAHSCGGAMRPVPDSTGSRAMDLISAKMGRPGASPSSAAAARVILARNRCPPTRISVSANAVDPSSATSTISPSSTFRMLIPSGRRSARATSRARTCSRILPFADAAVAGISMV